MLRFHAALTAMVVAFYVSATPAGASPDIWTADGWKTDFSKSTVAWSSVLSGGPPKNGIPAIDRPKFVPIADAGDLAPTEPVIGLEINGTARAYPLRVLMWHEIANDTLGDVPIAVTYCPLCNAAIVFDRRHNGNTLDFGTTGKLRNSDLIMYDRQSESWWQQFTGEGIAGLHAGQHLKMLPSRLESFERFRARHPKGTVLVPNNPGFRPYGRNPYASYDTRTRPFLYDGAFPEGIEPMARVIVYDLADGSAHAVDMAHVRARGSVTIDDVTLSWTTGQNSALDTASIAKGRDVGNIVVQRADRDIRHDVTFAFVYHAFHPNGEIVQSAD